MLDSTWRPTRGILTSVAMALCLTPALVLALNVW